MTRSEDTSSFAFFHCVRESVQVYLSVRWRLCYREHVNFVCYCAVYSSPFSGEEMLPDKSAHEMDEGRNTILSASISRISGAFTMNPSCVSHATHQETVFRVQWKRKIFYIDSRDAQDTTTTRMLVCFSSSRFQLSFFSSTLAYVCYASTTAVVIEQLFMRVRVSCVCKVARQHLLEILSFIRG